MEPLMMVQAYEWLRSYEYQVDNGITYGNDVENNDHRYHGDESDEANNIYNTNNGQNNQTPERKSIPISSTPLLLQQI